MSTDPADRVRAFLAEFEEAWRRFNARGSDGPFDFAAWREQVSAVDARHFVPGAGSGAEGSFQWGTPPHGPEHEQIVEVVAEGDGARVETRSDEMTYHEYLLVRQGDAWRIRRLMYFMDPRGAPFDRKGRAQRWLSVPSLDAPLSPATGDDPEYAEAMFQPGRLLYSGAEASPIEVRRVGVWNLTSGIVGIFDFGYLDFDFEPLARRIPPGSYPVDVSVAFGRNAAARVVLVEGARIARWCTADKIEDGGEVVGVDAGNVAILDAAALARCEARHKERLYQRAVVEAPTRPAATFVDIEGPQDALVLDSGWGDGGYPAFWGVDEQDRPVVLQIDFRLATLTPRP